MAHEKQEVFEMLMSNVMEKDQDGFNTLILMLASTHCDHLHRINENLSILNERIRVQTEVMKNS